MRGSGLILCALLGGGVASGMAGGQLAAASAKPNVLFIVSDDLNSWLGCYGNNVVKTPHLDRLAARAVRFDRAYCQYPLCNPSRASFLSGRYPSTTKIVSNNTPARTFIGNAPFLPEWFRQHGYFTARSGKIAHSNFANELKWDFEEGGPGRSDEGLSEAEKKAALGPDGMPIKKSRLEATMTVRMVEDDADTQDGQAAATAVKLLERKHDKPFFIGVGFHKPHAPLVAPKKYFSQYPFSAVKLFDERPGTAPPLAYSGHSGDGVSVEARQKAVAAYRACVSFMDAQVGKLLEVLDRKKLWDSTIVVFTSDHGYHMGEHGLWGKGTLFEVVARVPLLIAVPGKKPAVSPRTVELVDLFPTLVDLTGLPAPRGLEGKSLKALIDDPGAVWDKPAYTVVTRDQEMGVAVRGERFRYAEWGKARKPELYDLTQDPHERINLARDPAYAKTAAQLSALLRKKWPTKTQQALVKASKIR